MFIDSATLKEVNIHYAYKGYSRLDTPEIRAAAGVIEIPEPQPAEGIRADVDANPDHYVVSHTSDQLPPYRTWERKPDAQIADLTLAKAKTARQAEVEALTVTTQAGNTFDGDETSQTRMARAILALQATNTPDVKWVLANNVPTVVGVAELVEALALAGAAQAAIWSQPYEA